jgi:proline dehydrogenase
VNASAWALGITARIIQPGETPDGVLGQLIKRLGLPAVRGAIRRAMRLLGDHFVLGQTIEQALERARTGTGRPYRYSFDMLGEGREPQRTRDAILSLTTRRSRQSAALSGLPACHSAREFPSSSRHCTRDMKA